MSHAACTDSHILTNVHLNTTDQSGSTSPLMRFYELLAAHWQVVTDDRDRWCLLIANATKKFSG